MISNANSKLELFELSSERVVELVSIDIPSSFNRIIWTSVEAGCKDLIIGAFENGKVEVFDSQMLMDAESDGIIKTPNLHTDSVKGLCLSKFQPNLIASGSINGEIALWDLDNLGKASIMNIGKSPKFGGVSYMSWNPKVPHIISAASDSGIVSIIDLRSKKEVTALSVSEKSGGSASCAVWHPEISTNILVSNDSKSQPYVYLFDLRNPNSAQSVFQEHTDGVLSLSWCQSDPQMVLSSGRDGRSLCWNPSSNEVIREYSHQGVFDIQWCPKDANIFMASTFENGILFHSINECESRESVAVGKNEFSPQWLNCPIGASFGGNNSCSVFRPGNRKVDVFKPKIDVISDIYHDLIQFESSINRSSITSICENLHDSEIDNDDKLLWKIISLLSSSDVRSDLLDLIDQTFNESSKPNEAIKMQEFNSLLNDIHVSGAFSSEIADKIVNSDLEGAVLKCIEANRFADALFISNFGTDELRVKTEKEYLQRSSHFYLSLAKCIGRKEYDVFVSTSPIEQWRNILRVICLHAAPDTLPTLARILFLRLINEGLERQALFVGILCRDFEKIVEIYLEKIRSIVKNDNNASNAHDNIIKAYKLLRILEFICPNYVKSFISVHNKIAVFEIETKIKALLSSFGYDDGCIYNFQGKDFYTDIIRNKHQEIDLFVESRLGGPLSHSVQGKMAPVTHAVVDNTSNSRTQSILTPALTHTIASNSIQNNPVWITRNIMYNDAPIVNPKLSKLSPKIGNQEINPDSVQKALNRLADAVSSKALPETTVNLASNCFAKLSKDLICSKNYSSLSKASIIAIFEELGSGKFDTASSLAANILASYFSETKDWILPLKRLIEIVKN